MAPAKQNSKSTVSVPILDIKPPRQAHTFVVIKGITPLVMHKFGELARDGIEQDQGFEGKKPKVRKARNIEQDYAECFHYLPGYGPNDSKLRYAFPANGMKQAMIAALREVDGITMTLGKQLFFVSGHEPGPGREFMEIFGIPEMRRDVVRLKGANGGTMDLRYRPYFWPWSGIFRLRWNGDLLSLETILNLVARAGQSVGIGDRRPGKEGSEFGQFEISQAASELDDLSIFATKTKTKKGR